MIYTRAFPANDRNEVFVDGVKLGSVQSVRELETSSVYKVERFGDALPAAVLSNDVEYTVELRRELPIKDGISFDTIDNFTLRVRSRIYSGCRCARIERITKPDEPETEVITIAAESRQEAQNE